MKLFLLAAAAVIATPALAQMQPGTQSGTSTPDSAAPATPADTANPPGTTAQDPAAAPATPSNAAGDPVGGYQPTGSPMTGTMTPGVTPVFRAAPSPTEAYPAPAPLASYPVCKAGQFDKCMNGPRSTHSRQVRRQR